MANVGIKIDSTVLRTLREDRMWSLNRLAKKGREFARSIGEGSSLSRATLCRAEHGEHDPSPDTLRYVVGALRPSLADLHHLLRDAQPPEALVRLCQDAPRLDPSPRHGGQAADDAEWQAISGKGHDTKRVEFFKLIFAFGCTPAPLDAIERVARTRDTDVSDALVADYETLTSALAQAYQQARPARLARAAQLHLDRLARVLDASAMEPTQRQRLTRCSGDTATLLGLLTFHTGQPSVAAGHLEDARRLARETGDPTLHAQALGSMSILHATSADGGRSGNPAAALELLDEAGARALHAPAAIRAWLAARRSEEQAAAHDASAFQRALEQARTALDVAASEGDAGGFLAVFSGWDTTAMDGFEGVGYVLLKRPYEAEAALRRGLALAEGARRRANQLADLGAALALQNEPEMSTEVLHESLTLALKAGNAMGVERIRGVRAAFPESWALLPCVRELDDRLRKAALSSS
ncbi:MAG: hypothetical protein ACRDZ4_10140 [Egibacteraceae bacterium]